MTQQLYYIYNILSRNVLFRSMTRNMFLQVGPRLQDVTSHFAIYRLTCIQLFVVSDTRITGTIFPSCRFLTSFYFRFVHFQIKMSRLILVIYYTVVRSRDKSICKATGYVLEGPCSIPGMKKFLQTGYGAHRASHPMGVGGYFSGSKTERA
jgi:hypothetical protein